MLQLCFGSTAHQQSFTVACFDLPCTCQSFRCKLLAGLMQTLCSLCIYLLSLQIDGTEHIIICLCCTAAV